MTKDTNTVEQALRDSLKWVIAHSDGKELREYWTIIQTIHDAIDAISEAAQPAPMPTIRKFYDLPLGTCFRYIGGRDVWVILERLGFGKVAKYEPHDGWVAGQSICSFADTKEECKTLEVEVIATLPPQAQPVQPVPLLSADEQITLGMMLASINDRLNEHLEEEGPSDISAVLQNEYSLLRKLSKAKAQSQPAEKGGDK